MAKGDHFFVWRQHRGVPFQHHGIDVGDGTVVHFTDGEGGVAGPGGLATAYVVMRTPLSVVIRDGRDVAHIVAHADPLHVDTVVDRALSQVGRRGYHLLYDNCEHFAFWCVKGREESRQVNVACERLSAAGFKAMATGTFRVASRIGARRVIRGASAWMLVAEAAQWATEAGGHHIGLNDPEKRRLAGRAVGGATSVGLGALGGPIGIVVAGTIWVAGELAGEASCQVYKKVRQRRVR